MHAVLAFDTAAPILGVALWIDGSVWSRTAPAGRGSERRLLPLATALLDEAGQSLDAVTGVAVAAGPGAFTGIRVGLATAGGLAQALGCPVVPIGSHAPRAARVGGDDQLLVWLDARKGRVYAGRWVHGRSVDPIRDIEPQHVLAEITPPFQATGEGAIAFGDSIRAAGGTVVADAGRPGVAALAILGAQRLIAGEGIAPSALRPDYHREPDAVPPRGGPKEGRHG